MNKITVLKEGYSEFLDNDPRGEVMKANCTCTLIQCHTGENILIDTLDAWSGKPLLEALSKAKVKPEDINFCISTHCHPDHMGNNNLFLAARHVVGNTISEKDEYFLHDFTKESFVVNSDVEVVATKGHTLTCVSIICRNSSLEGKTVVIAGDLFENGKDIDNPELWKEAGTEAMEDQVQNRWKMAMIADYIVPGHGAMFKVTNDMREKLKQQAF